MADFVPDSDDALVNWLNNLKTKIATHGPTLGMTAAQITAFQNRATALITALQLPELKQQEYKAALAAEATAKQTELSLFRTDIAAMKTNPANTPAIAQDLGIVGTVTVLDPTTYKASITVEAHNGFVRIKFKKLGVSGVNIYRRLKGQAAWTFVARDTNSPNDDHTPLAVANTSEVREYRAFGVVRDEEFGEPSDIASVTFNG